MKNKQKQVNKHVNKDVNKQVNKYMYTSSVIINLLVAIIAFGIICRNNS